MVDLPLLEDADVSGRWVLVRADLNVPLYDGGVTDDFRIRASVPTLQHLIDARARVVICSHLGRPKGQVDEALRLRPVAKELSSHVGREVTPVPEVVGRQAEAAVHALDPGHVVLLENLRFHPGETANDAGFVGELASLGEVYVNDAFGASHRAHASVVGVPERRPSYAGLLLAEEIETLTGLLSSPRSPFVVVLGGAKVSDKLGVVRSLLERGADRICIGGGMCFAFLKADGADVGGSLVDEEHVSEVREVLAEFRDRIVLPTDVVVGSDPDAASADVVAATGIPSDLMGLDVGPETADAFAEVVLGAGTVFWNGPLGVFENDAFAAGTRVVAEAVAACPGRTVTGGGDTAAALAALDLDDEVDFLSTGGGASLELLEGKTLPGVEALVKAKQRQQEGA